MESNERRIELANRLLSYREYGDLTGKPVFYFHGFPSSSLEASYLNDAACERGIRLIAPDRPGMGDSSMSPNLRITRWPRDVITLADRLHLDRFGILGFATGAPYALACGHSISRRINAIGIVSGNVPGRSHVKATAKAFAALALLPLKARMFRDPERAERAWQALFDGTAEREIAASRDPQFRSAMLAGLSNAFLEGSGGPAKDYAIATGANWGFALANIPVENITIWHGDADTRVPVAEMRRLSERLPHCTMHVLAHEGHYSTLVNHHQEILDTFTR